MSTTVAPQEGPKPGALAASIEACIDIFIHPTAAFHGVAAGASAFVPLAVLTLQRVVRDFLFYSPSTEPVRFALTVALSGAIIALPVLLSAAYLRVALWLRTTDAGSARVLALVAYAWLPGETLRWVATCAYGLTTSVAEPKPGAQPFTNLGWLVPAVENQPLHHVLGSLDVATAIILALVVAGLPRVARGVTRTTAAALVLGGWLALLLVTTAIKVYVS